MTTLWHDIRYGLRTLWGSPGFGLVVVALVAIGVGVSTTVFSILYPILLRPLPYEDPDRIVYVWGRDRQGGMMLVSHSLYRDWQQQATSFEELSCYTFRDRAFSPAAGAPPEECCIGYVSENFFRIFPVRPAVGRLLMPADDRPGAAPVVVLGHAFWCRHFAADPNALGQSLLLDNVSHTIVGVTGAAFDFLPYGADATDVWVAVAPGWSAGGRGNRQLDVLGKLKAGVSLQQAQAEMDAVEARLVAEYSPVHTPARATVIRVHEAMTRPLGHLPAILMGAVLTVFLVACANVAGLMFARGVTREREMALRAALGATRLRLVRLMFLENVVLALLGGGLGVLGATWAIKGFLGTGILPAAQFPAGFFRPDWHVLGFALALSILGAPACGLLPSIRCSGARLARTLAAGSRSILGSRSRNAAHLGLLTAQVALTIVLLVAAGLMIRSLVNFARMDRGFDPRNVLALDLELAPERYGSREARLAFHRRLLQELGTVPGIDKVALTSSLLGGWHWPVHVPDEPVAPSGEEPRMVLHKAVSPGYFETMGIRLLRGRFFDERDQPGAPPVVIVDETLARRYWPDGDAVGQRLQTGDGAGPNPPWAEVVGVVRNVKHWAEADSSMQVYQPFLQKALPWVSVVLRTTGDPKSFIAAVKETIGRMDRLQFISNARTFDDVLPSDALLRHFVAGLLTASAGIALFLSAVGIYALTRYSIARRTQEFGIRMALGADRGQVLKLMLGKALVPLLAGLAAGLVTTVAVARVLSSFLFQLSPWDPATYVAVSLLLILVVLLACYLPARRAARIDPMVALRYE
ncbi:MAG: ABC transporter permease [Planctomycetes bacterium]|nr:ABC transporter permease [Planctomycetota bacterium]